MITKAHLEHIACELKHYLFISKCRLLITFANSLDPVQAPQTIDTLMVFLKEFFEKVDFDKNQQTTKKNNPRMQCKALMRLEIISCKLTMPIATEPLLKINLSC